MKTFKNIFSMAIPEVILFDVCHNLCGGKGSGMKRFMFWWLLAGILYVLSPTPVSASPATHAEADAGGMYDSQESIVDFGQVPNDSLVDVNGPASTRARARALHTGVIGVTATNTGNYVVSGIASLRDRLIITLSEAVPGADGIALRMHLSGAMSLNNSANFNGAFTQFDIFVRNSVNSNVARGRLYLSGNGATHTLVAPTHDYDSGVFLDNLFLHPRNQPSFPIGSSSTNFNISGPLYIFLKGINPSYFNSGVELTIEMVGVVFMAPGVCSFYDSLTFDTERPVFLYASGSNDIIYLPQGSTYRSSAGMGIPADLTEPVPNPPTPNPMTWAAAPAADSPTSITMTATTATAQDCPPVSYYFEFVGSPTDGGTGGEDSGWQTSTQYVNTGLEPNHRYGYVVTAASCFPVYQETAPSTPNVFVYTWANDPTPAPFSNITRTAIRANWAANGNPGWTEYWCENTDTPDNSGWITNTYWSSTGLTPGATYHFRVKARNGDLIKDTAWVDLGSQDTTITVLLYLPLILK
jgi:hypothetical protein